MARARLLKPGFFTNEHLAELPYEGRLLFAGLWTLADREGRLEDRAKRIKAAVFPFDEIDVSGLLIALEQRGFIERYDVDAMALIQIAKFLDHQKPHAREAASTLPGPKHNLGSAEAQPRWPVSKTVPKTVTGNGSDSSATSAKPSTVLMEFAVVGMGLKTWPLSAEQVAVFATAFPNIDVLAEMRKAWVWIDTNPGRRKTFGGMPSFLAKWLTRSVDRRTEQERRDQPRGSQDRRGGRTFDCLRGDCIGAEECRTAPQCLALCKGQAS